MSLGTKLGQQKKVERITEREKNRDKSRENSRDKNQKAQKKCPKKDEINTQRRRRKVEKSKIGRKICMTVIGLRKSAGVTVIRAMGMPVSP